MASDTPPIKPRTSALVPPATGPMPPARAAAPHSAVPARPAATSRIPAAPHPATTPRAAARNGAATPAPAARRATVAVPVTVVRSSSPAVAAAPTPAPAPAPATAPVASAPALGRASAAKPVAPSAPAVTPAPPAPVPAPASAATIAASRPAPAPASAATASRPAPAPRSAAVPRPAVVAASVGGAAPVNFKLPAAVYSPQLLESVVYDIQYYLDWIRQNHIRKTVGAKPKDEPNHSDETVLVIEAWLAGQPATVESIEGLLDYLRKLKLPEIHVMLAALPNRTQRLALVDWFRNNASPEVLLSFVADRNLGGGIVVRTPNRVFDFSWKQELIAGRAKLAEILKRV